MLCGVFEWEYVLCYDVTDRLYEWHSACKNTATVNCQESSHSCQLQSFRFWMSWWLVYRVLSSTGQVKHKVNAQRCPFLPSFLWCIISWNWFYHLFISFSFSSASLDTYPLCAMFTVFNPGPLITVNQLSQHYCITVYMLGVHFIQFRVRKIETSALASLWVSCVYNILCLGGSTSTVKKDQFWIFPW